MKGIHQWQLAFHNEWVLCSTTSIVFSKDWFVHVPLLAAWEFCLTQDMWCWDDEGWLSFCCVSAIN